MALPVVNGVDPQEDQIVDGRTKRVWATLPLELVKAIDFYWHSQQLPTRSHGIEDLIRLGLRSAQFRNKTLT